MTKLKAVFFDMDGVIIDTERDGHRVAFNRAFSEFGLDIEWDIEKYHGLLQTGGGKERIKCYFEETGFDHPVYSKNPEQFIKDLHKKKTEIFMELIKEKKLPLRPGVERLMKEINDQGLSLAICTTSNENAATTVRKTMLSDIKIDFMIAGDMVSSKKPDPEIYLTALERLGIMAKEAIVIEDSHIGVTAASRAGIPVVATVNDYTRNENFDAAELVVSCLGDNNGIHAERIGGKNTLSKTGDCITLETLCEIIEHQ